MKPLYRCSMCTYNVGPSNVLDAGRVSCGVELQMLRESYVRYMFKAKCHYKLRETPSQTAMGETPMAP
jgi:hypothetical protein